MAQETKHDEVAVDDDSSDGDEPCLAYMFDGAAATEERTLQLTKDIAVRYYCLEASEDAAKTAHISGHSAWPAAATLAKRVVEDWDLLPHRSALELGCGCGVVGLACAALGCQRVEFTDRDEGALKLARRAVELQGFSGCTAARRSWGAAEFAGETFDLVVGSDLIYDPGVVGPLVAAAAAALADGGCFLLSQSFALGDESTAALKGACAARGLRLELVDEDGAATFWRARRRESVSAIAARCPAFELAPLRFLVCWRGVLALAFEGWPLPVERLKRNLDGALGDALPAENPGSKWPKVSLAAVVDGAAPLSPADYEALDGVLRSHELPGSRWGVEALALTLYAQPSHEFVLDAKRIALGLPGRDAAAVSEAARSSAAAVVAETAEPSYVDQANLPGGAPETYRAVARGASLVAFLDDAALRAAVDALRARVDAAFPGRYAWFDADARHCTLRALA